MSIESKKILRYWWLLAFILGFFVGDLSIAVWFFLDELTHSLEVFSIQGLETFGDCLKAGLLFAVPSGIVSVFIAWIGIGIYQLFKSDQNL